MVWSFVQATVLSVPGSLLNLHRGLAAGPTLGLADLVLEATCFRFGSFLSAVCRCLPCPKGAGVVSLAEEFRPSICALVPTVFRIWPSGPAVSFLL